MRLCALIALCLVLLRLVLQMPPPSATYGPLLNLVSLNMSGESSAPGLSWYNENATSQVCDVRRLLATAQPCPRALLSSLLHAPNAPALTQ